MSLTAALNSAVSALRVNQAQVQLASANIAHAQDPNYTKKSLRTEAVTFGNGQVGGVMISGYASTLSVTLRKQVEAQTATSGASDATNEYMSRIQDLLGTSADQSSLTKAMNSFISAWQDFQSQPDSAAAQQAIVGAGSQIGNEIHRVAAGLDQLDTDVRSDIGNSVNQLNDLLKQLFQVNLQMKTALTDSSASADLTDQRDNLVKQIAQYVDVRTVEQDDGSVSLFTAAGLQLLDGPPSLFSYDGTNVTRVSDGASINNQLSGGRIHALLNFRQDSSASGKAVSMDPGTEVIRKLRAQLDMMVGALTTTSGTPPSLSAAYNAAGTSQRVSASFQTTVTPTAYQAQYSTVNLSGALQTGDVFSITVQGKNFSYTATDGDKSLDQIAAQLSAQINADTTLGITAIPGIASLQLVGNTLGQSFTVQTAVNNQIPELDGNLFTGTNRYDFQMNAALLNGSLQLKKNSASDVVKALTSTDRNFLATGIALTSVSYSGMMTGVVGSSITGAKQLSDQAKFDADSLDMSTQRYQSDTGVNLDEEIANLQVLQNAYAASARLLTVVQEMFDTLEQAVR
ncbi:flagellar hook-associated protein FlgK [Dongia sedimenti]|uniref:Flagellar hook-associated protein 1 n=1 Tax=Dongia sedimenti TaxID=3064282 RepID=A0ABU0YHH2_9PROT|nr:flagellar basal body rod C-terminal domain-containing protein [Rhodospirillaceae bacterium R-7]